MRECFGGLGEILLPLSTTGVCLHQKHQPTNFGCEHPGQETSLMVRSGQMSQSVTRVTDSQTRVFSPAIHNFLGSSISSG